MSCQVLYGKKVFFFHGNVTMGLLNNQGIAFQTEQYAVNGKSIGDAACHYFVGWDDSFLDCVIRCHMSWKL